MPEASQIAAAINLRMRQLEATGITGIALANQMVGHMQELKVIYDTASDRTLKDLCRRFPAFERYARLMEQVSQQSQEMTAAGTHPYAWLQELPDALKTRVMGLLRGAAELESEFQDAVDAGHGGEAERLTTIKQQWANDLVALVGGVQQAGLPLQTQAFLQQILKSTAERIERLSH